MNYDQLTSHFGGPTKAAEALGLDDRRAVAAWKDRRIPSKWQMKAQAITNGVLKADKEAQTDAAEMAGYVEQVKGLAA